MLRFDLMSKQSRSKSLTADQNLFVRACLRELHKKLKEWKLVAERVGLDPSGVSQMADDKSTRGTSLDVLIRAAVETNKSAAEICKVLGIPHATGIGKESPDLTAALAQQDVTGATASMARSLVGHPDAPMTVDGWRELLMGVDMIVKMSARRAQLERNAPGFPRADDDDIDLASNPALRVAKEHPPGLAVQPSVGAEEPARARKV